jgi:hypothetical protein
MLDNSCACSLLLRWLALHQNIITQEHDALQNRFRCVTKAQVCMVVATAKLSWL